MSCTRRQARCQAALGFAWASATSWQTVMSLMCRFSWTLRCQYDAQSEGGFETSHRVIGSSRLSLCPLLHKPGYWHSDHGKVQLDRLEVGAVAIGVGAGVLSRCSRPIGSRERLHAQYGGIGIEAAAICSGNMWTLARIPCAVWRGCLFHFQMRNDKCARWCKHGAGMCVCVEVRCRLSCFVHMDRVCACAHVFVCASVFMRVN